MWIITTRFAEYMMLYHIKVGTVRLCLQKKIYHIITDHGQEFRAGSFRGGGVEEENREGKERKGDGQINGLSVEFIHNFLYRENRILLIVSYCSKHSLTLSI